MSLSAFVSEAIGSELPDPDTTIETPAPPGITKTEAARWRLSWRDEFDGDTLDDTKWNYRYLGPRESALIALDCVTLNGRGLLHLLVKEKDGVLQNAMIGTQGKFEARFGIMAARIRFPRQQGQHGSFWMQPAIREKGLADAARHGAEIDIIEWFGAGRKDGGTASNVYWTGSDGKLNRAGRMMDLHHLLKPGETWSDDFHVYSDRTKLPNSMDVDWVRVWQRSPERTTEEPSAPASPASSDSPSAPLFLRDPQ